MAQGRVEEGGMRLLDLFCCAGGAGMGYHQAGFEVVGVDINPQPRYPFEFHQADALEYALEFGHLFDVIHASPPCQFYSESTPMDKRANHPDLIGETRRVLAQVGKPYIIENVEGAGGHLIDPIMLCGSMFGLPTIRHRYFECYPPLTVLLPPCDHVEHPILMTPAGSNSRRSRKARTDFESVGIDWMSRAEISQAIPPAYTKFIGEQLLEQIRRAA
jgi:DNA (cytosine-5)-methyltransferase 1